MFKNTTAAEAATSVKIIKKTAFTLKSRPEIAPQGFQKATVRSVVNETPEHGDAFNRVVAALELTATDIKGNPFLMDKIYNLNGRGATAFLDDYNAWSGAGLTENDLYSQFDAEQMVGKPLVVGVGHRKVGSEWQAYITSFHPAGFTGEPAPGDEIPAAAAVTQK